MILKEVCFTNIARQGFIGLAIMQNGKCIAEGSFKEVLNSIPQLANMKIKEQRPYFNEWVIELTDY